MIINGLIHELIFALENESIVNPNSMEFLKYVQENKFYLSNTTNQFNQNLAIDTIRGINRFSDEFNFTNKNKTTIKSLIYKIYDNLNIVP